MIKNFLVTLVVFLGIDLVWLGFVAKKFYDKQLESFPRTLNIPAAFLSYLLIVIGLVLFVQPKQTTNIAYVFFWGALYGTIVYGVYDLVNLATLKNWTIKMTVVDMLWGALVCGVVSVIVRLILK